MTKTPEDIAREIGGDGLIRFFDAIESRQKTRGNGASWRTQAVSHYDITNWGDVAAALRSYADSRLEEAAKLFDHGPEDNRTVDWVYEAIRSLKSDYVTR